MGAPKFQKSCEVLLCTSPSLQNTNGQEIELICWACWGSQHWFIFPTPCRDQVHGRNLQLHADGNDARCDPIYMHMQMLMKCLWNALGMLMHACNLVRGPPALRLFLCCSGSSPWLCRRGYMQLRQGLYKRVAVGHGPIATPYG